MTPKRQWEEFAEALETEAHITKKAAEKAKQGQQVGAATILMGNAALLLNIATAARKIANAIASDEAQ